AEVVIDERVRRALAAVEVVAERREEVDVALDDLDGQLARSEDPLEALLARAEVLRLLAEHEEHGLRHLEDARVREERELRAAVPVHELEEAVHPEPVVDRVVERAEEALVARLRRSPFEEALGAPARLVRLQDLRLEV